MHLNDIIDKLSVIQERMTAGSQLIARPFLDTISLRNYRGALITGPRGVGKTSFLLREAQKQGNVLYVSADHPLVSTVSLWDLGEKAYLTGYSAIIFDEVHFAADWSKHLKTLYDAFPKLSIWASDSSSMILRRGTHDLSRRFPNVSIPFLSLREYVALRGLSVLAPFDPFVVEPQIFDQALAQVAILPLFRDYLQEGFRPIFQEGFYQDRLLAMLEKTIMADIPFFVPGIHENHLRLMLAIMGHLAKTPIPTLNIDSLSKDWSVGKEKLYALLAAMEAAGLITIVRLQNDYKVTGKGAKIFFSDPTLYGALNGELGNVREAFVVATCKQAGKSVYAAEKEIDGDLLIDGKLVEVGGQKKKRKKADFVIRDDTERLVGNGLPIWSLGMMY